MTTMLNAIRDLRGNSQIFNFSKLIIWSNITLLLK